MGRFCIAWGFKVWGGHTLRIKILARKVPALGMTGAKRSRRNLWVVVSGPLKVFMNRYL